MKPGRPLVIAGAAVMAVLFAYATYRAVQQIRTLPSVQTSYAGFTLGESMEGVIRDHGPPNMVYKGKQEFTLDRLKENEKVEDYSDWDYRMPVMGVEVKFENGTVSFIGCRLQCPELLHLSIGEDQEKVFDKLGKPDGALGHTVSYKDWNVWYRFVDGQIETMGIAALRGEK